MNPPNEKARVATARTLARNLIKLCKYKNPPVLLKDILAHLKEEQRIYISSWNFGDNISGIIVFEEDFSAIGYNQQQHVHRNRFTVAHEIGHLLFNHTCTKGDGFGGKSPSEIEANQFAAELLMPLAFLKADMQRGLKKVEDLAARYWVSKEALGWRISDPHSKLLSYI